MDSNNDRQNEDLSYQVMPKSSGPLLEPTPVGQTKPAQTPAPNPVPASSAPALSSRPETPVIPQANHAIDNGMLPMEPEHRFSGKILYIIITIVILAGLGVAAYMLLGGKSKDTDDGQGQASNLPKVWLLKNFGAETCVDANVCGDNADPDADGLKNLDEFESKTNPKAADTDGDGLADGDEIHIYKTEPTLKYTDKREVAMSKDYNDGSQIANDYDPLTPGIKMTAGRKDQVAKDTQTYVLHEPTKTTMLKLRSSSAVPATNPQSFSVHIQASSFNPPTLTVSKGDTLVWLNDDVMKHQVISDPHPSHSDYPTLSSPVLEKNGTFTFKFTDSGTFKYHDEQNPALKGTIEVK